jgi:hypothetical protein
VLRRSLGRLARLRLHVDADRLAVTALRTAAPGPCQALFDAGRDGGLDLERALDRAGIAFCNFAAFNLSDDLSDGDCSYLPAPAGNAVVLLLQGAFLAGLRELGIGPHTEDAVVADLTAAADAQVLELTTTSWDADRLWVVTDGIAGRQWSAYLRLMWTGTAVEGCAPDVARLLGRVALLVGDIRSSDRRYTELSRTSRKAVLDSALRCSHDLRAYGFAFTDAVVADALPCLLKEVAATSAEHPVPRDGREVGTGGSMPTSG